ncbi:hypothetical protein FEV13_16660 [Stutzerimonas degradans]|nr:hypothetical protein FEV13_16660 [Stutzerimonas degradans]
MRIRYVVPIKQKVIISDHWDIPFQGGVCRVLENEGFATALELEFKKEPVTYAPKSTIAPDGSLLITARDLRLPFVHSQLHNAMSFIHCFYCVDLDLDGITAYYEPESEIEKPLIPISSMTQERYSSALPLPFDFLTRSIFLANARPGPTFESTLASTARKAFAERQYINAFRYAFLLIESSFGKGQFKSAALKSALKESQEFLQHVEVALNNFAPPPSSHASKTDKLFQSGVNASEFIEHLVEMRGFYFHANINRPGTWRPERQESAATLAHISIEIAQLIAQQAASPLFESHLQSRHFESAEQAGAIIVYNIQYEFRQPDETRYNLQELSVRMPGTKPTPEMTMQLLELFLNKFKEDQPVAHLKSAVCVVDSTCKKVFELKIASD